MLSGNLKQGFNLHVCFYVDINVTFQVILTEISMTDFSYQNVSPKCNKGSNEALSFVDVSSSESIVSLPQMRLRSSEFTEFTACVCYHTSLLLDRCTAFSNRFSEICTQNKTQTDAKHTFRQTYGNLTCLLLLSSSLLSADTTGLQQRKERTRCTKFLLLQK